MDPLGTTFQSAMADLKEPATSRAAKIEKIQLFQMRDPFFSEVWDITDLLICWMV